MRQPWSRRLLPAVLQREHMAGQAVRFVTVGVLNTGVDLGAFYLLGSIPGMPDIAAKAVSYILGIINSFVWNKYWTFGAGRSAKGKREFAVFFAVNTPPLLVNVVAFTLLGLWVGQGTFWVRMSKAFAAAVVSVAWNFMGSRYLAFRHTALRGRRTQRGGRPLEIHDPAAVETVEDPAEAFAPNLQFSVVIPVHNEAECLLTEVNALTAELQRGQVDYELILAENGSTDQTGALAEALAQQDPHVRVLRLPSPDYGAAMKAGMLAARGQFVVNFDIDFHDVDFMLRALPLLDSCGVVVGSKLMAGAEDRRPPLRHLVSWGFTTMLRLLFDWRMDDTHGIKVLRREVVRRFAPQTVMTRDLFDTELIIRARRAGVKVGALPVRVEEKRKPRSSIVRRIPRTLRGLLRLRFVLWKEGSAGA
ncbi:MAG: GtrA family protein [Thermoleophilia bacterium]|nr:GtrA family protein [Thermoleophilia bacterium]